MAFQTFDTTIKIPITVRRQTSPTPLWEAYHGPAQADTVQRIFAVSTVCLDDALAAMQAKIQAALAEVTPIVVWWQNIVGIAYHDPHFGWAYRILVEPDAKPQQIVPQVVLDKPRAEVERALRAHVAQLIGGPDGAQLIADAQDLDNHWRHHVWQEAMAAGARRDYPLRLAQEDAEARQADYDRHRSAGLPPQSACALALCGAEPGAVGADLVEEAPRI